MDEFFETFDCIDDNRVYLEDFLHYFEDISLTIDDDNFFVFMVEKSWGL